MRLVFAFGALMHEPTVQGLCPRAVRVGPGRADGFAFRIMQHGFATLVPAPGRAVHGLLWRVGPVEEAILDDYEDVDLGLYVKRQIAVSSRAGTHRATAYLTRTIAPGRPRRGYMDGRVLPAARALGFPADYLAELEGWAAKAGYVPSPFDFY